MALSGTRVILVDDEIHIRYLLRNVIQVEGFSVVGEAYNGDDVLLFGAGADGRPESGIALQELCDKLGTIPYELLCRVSARVPRMYVGD